VIEDIDRLSGLPGVFGEEGREFFFGGGRPEVGGGHNGILQGAMTFALGLWNSYDDIRNDAFGHFRVFVKVLDDHFDGDVFFVGFPAVVIGDHGHGGVGDLGFAGAFGFAKVSHADDGEAGLVVEKGFGACAEGGAFHIYIGSAVMRFGPRAFRAGRDQIPQLGANGLCEGDVRHYAAAKKGVLRTPLGFIDELIGQDDFTGLEFCLQRTDGADADDPTDTEFLERINVGAMIQFSGQEFVPAGVARQENDFAAAQDSSQQLIGRIAKGRLDLQPFLIGEAFDVVEAAAADNTDARFFHAGGLVAGREGQCKQIVVDPLCISPPKVNHLNLFGKVISPVEGGEFSPDPALNFATVERLCKVTAFERIFGEQIEHSQEFFTIMRAALSQKSIASRRR
jgi:hypothetical protein